MSWSVSSFGKPAAVKAALAIQFDSAKKNTVSIPHESESVAGVETIVNLQLDFLAGLSNSPVVKVEASGSAYKSSDGTGNTNVSLNLQSIYGFVE